MNKLLPALCLMAFISAPANAVRNGTSVNRTSTNLANLVRITVGANTCSGTRITFDTVLTAAHCFGEDVSRSRFKVEYLNGDVTITEKIKVSSVIIKSRDLDQELAVFKINPRFGDDSLYKASTIFNYLPGKFNLGEKFLFAGYGMDDSENTNQLKQGHLKFNNTKATVETFKILNNKAMEARNKKHLAEIAKQPKVDKAAELPAVELNDCEDATLGWRGRRSCRKQNNYLLFQRELELRSITYEMEQEEKALQDFLETPIYKTKLVKGFEMLVMMPLDNTDTLAEGEVKDQLPCPGDSGGPLYKELPNGEKVLVGIISNIVASSRVAQQAEEVEGYKTCAKATAANYIPVSLHSEFLRQFDITF